MDHGAPFSHKGWFIKFPIQDKNLTFKLQVFPSHNLILHPNNVPDYKVATTHEI